MTIKAVLLDVDGTLIDSVDEHAQAWVDVCAEYGFTVEFDNVRRLIGMGSDRVLPELTGVEKDSELGRQMTSRRAEIFQEDFLPTLQPFPQVRELLERFVADGYQLVTASSASVKDLNALLERAGVQDLFDAQTSSDDADASKPAPDIIEAALQRAGCQPHEAVMVGDTPYDVTAANRAGVECVAFRSGGWDDHDLHAAAVIYDDAADLLARYEASLFAT